MTVRLFIFFLLLAGTITVFSQSIPVSKFFVPPGKIPSAFTCSYTSSQGFVYAGTTTGLYKCNGLALVPTAITDTVTAIAESRDKKLYAGLSNGKIGTLTSSGITYFTPEEGLSKKPISSMLFDAKNNLWFAVSGEGIYYTSNNHLYLIDEADGLEDVNITRLFIAPNGNVLASSDNGFYICSAEGSKKNIKNISPKQGLPDYIVTCFENSTDGTVFIGLQDKGVCQYNTKTGEVKSITPNWQYGEVSSLSFSNNTLWIAARETGIFKMNIGITNAKPVKINGQTATIQLTKDKEENIWLLSRETLSKTTGNKLAFFPAFTKAEFDAIHAVAVTKNGDIWAGTDGGIVKYYQDHEKYAAKKLPISGLNAMKDVTSICEDAFGNLWVGSMGKGLFVVNPATFSYRSITENPILKDASILSVTASGNTVCAGGLEGVATIFELDAANVSIKNQYRFTNYDRIENIGNNYIYTIYKDKRQRIWFGTNANGITMLQNSQFTHYGHTNGLDAKNVLAFTEDTKGNIWFATENDGIYKFDDKAFHHLTIENGLSSSQITSIKTDAAGNIVVAHQNGIDIINPVTYRFSYLNVAQGVSKLSIDIGTMAAGPDGTILLTTEDGFINYHAPSAAVAPATFLESVLLHLKEIDTASRHRFAYDENSFTFNFIGLWNTSPEAVQYQYKLVGYDSNWVSTNDRSKSFAQLEPGKYTFKVRSSLSGNFNYADEASYYFIIEKAIWKRWWFILLCALLSAGLMYWYIKSREKEIRKMQQLENEKTNFQFQVLRNQVNPHFLFNSFNTLISTIEDNPKTGVDYAENLSDFFRHIVTYRDKDVITLEEELDILNTYMYLQQKRYGAYLQIDIEAPEKLQKDIYMPPLTLQLLAENAIKHNAVSSETPLHISIKVTSESIRIENNLNPKSVVEKSSGMGLQNIINRYALLSSRKVEVTKSPSAFLIILPSLKQSS